MIKSTKISISIMYMFVIIHDVFVYHAERIIVLQQIIEHR